MPRYLKRARPGILATTVWTGVVAAIWAVRSRTELSRTNQSLRNDGRCGAWIGAAALVGIALLLTVATASFYDGNPALWRRPSPLQGKDPQYAPSLMIRFGCAGCHTIPGVPGARGEVGPSLKGFARRTYIAGVLPNGPANLVRWLVNPPATDPHTAMPITGISAVEARSVAAYLLAQQ